MGTIWLEEWRFDIPLFQVLYIAIYIIMIHIKR